MKITLVFWILVAVCVTPSVFAQNDYVPPPESAGGWRRCKTPDDVRSLGGMDPGKLEILRQAQLALFAGPWQIVIIHHGYLVAEWYGLPAMPTTTFDGWSSTKSSTGIAYGLLLEDSRNHRLPHDAQISLDTPIYDYVPEGFPLSDPEKKKIKLRHILSMTSGIAGEDHGLIGLADTPGGGDYEIAFRQTAKPLRALTREIGRRTGNSLGILRRRLCAPVAFLPSRNGP